MTAAETIVGHYLSEFRVGHVDNAFHGLIEADPEVIPELIKACGDADDVHLQVFVIGVVAEFRLNSSLDFLRDVLRRDEAKIWQSALEGMARTETPESVDAMNFVLASVRETEKREWIEEAISDTSDAIRKRADVANRHSSGGWD